MKEERGVFSLHLSGRTDREAGRKEESACSIFDAIDSLSRESGRLKVEVLASQRSRSGESAVVPDITKKGRGRGMSPAKSFTRKSRKWSGKEM